MIIVTEQPESISEPKMGRPPFKAPEDKLKLVVGRAPAKYTFAYAQITRFFTDMGPYFSEMADHPSEWIADPANQLKFYTNMISELTLIRDRLKTELEQAREAAEELKEDA